jgi:inhibitor of KinA sporulation pathway (predicted exonuclease)
MAKERKNMPTTVYETTEIELMDGTKVKMRPLKISLLREFMKTFTKLEDVAADNDKSMDVLMDCVQVAMKQYSPEMAEDREILEDNIDLPSVYKIIEAASGIKFDDSGNALAAGRVGTN